MKTRRWIMMALRVRLVQCSGHVVRSIHGFHTLCFRQVAVTTPSMEQRLARTPGAYAVASGMTCRSTANSWCPLVLGQYRAGTMVRYSEADILSVAYDCSRLGQPKEETLMCAVLDPLRGLAARLPPQACMGVLHRRIPTISLTSQFRGGVVWSYAHRI